MTTNVVFFAIAAFFEIAGCFAFWIWVRRGATPFVVVLGVVSLIAFALALTHVDSAFAGRAYAAYGGIYIAASLVWLWLDGLLFKGRCNVVMVAAWSTAAEAVPKIVPASVQNGASGANRSQVARSAK